MWGSTTPVAITNLMTALDGAPAFAGVSVFDGPTVSSATVPEAVAVGFAGPDDATAVEGQLSAEGMTAAPDREQYTIRCAVMVCDGDAQNVAAVRARAYELLSAVAGVLADNPTLNGAVMVARLSDVTLTQSQSSAGVTASVAFGVFCDAYTTR